VTVTKHTAGPEGLALTNEAEPVRVWAVEYADYDDGATLAVFADKAKAVAFWRAFPPDWYPPGEGPADPVNCTTEEWARGRYRYCRKVLFVVEYAVLNEAPDVAAVQRYDWEPAERDVTPAEGGKS
jgi:hypothetical protein